MLVENYGSTAAVLLVVFDAVTNNNDSSGISGVGEPEIANNGGSTLLFTKKKRWA